MTAPSEEAVERVARALYKHWVQEDWGNEYCSWDLLRDKDRWRFRAVAALAALETSHAE